MDMVDAWSLAEDSILKVWDPLSLCLFGPNRNLRRVTAQGSLPFLESAGNLMTHPAIYGSNDPPGVGMFLQHSLSKGIPPPSEGEIETNSKKLTLKF
ncbi:hypothetical protein TNCV_194511 [Trichonephila clavipes]|nr:hypothetical protein TNCV_194511 [Trichonephila clavipes]